MQLLSTGIRELDDMLDGGLRPKYCYTINGTAGAGKTVLSLFLSWGAIKQGFPVLYVTTEVDSKRIESYFSSFNIDIRPYIENNMLKIEQVTLKRLGEVIIQKDTFDLSGITARITSKIKQINARLVIFDSLSSFLAEFEYKSTARRSYLDFIKSITALDTTLVITIERKNKEETDNIIDFIVDGVINIETEIHNNKIIKHISIPKLREARPEPYSNRLIINKKGIRILHSESKPLTFVKGSTGIARLDELLGGGIPEGSVVLVEINGEINYFPLFLTMLYSYLNRDFGVIIHSNVQMNPERIINEFSIVDFNIDKFLNDANIVFLDKYNRSVTSSEAKEISQLMSLDDILAITVEMITAFGDKNKVVLFGDLTDDANILDEKDFLKYFALQSYNIKEYKSISYSFINYNGIDKNILSRLRSTADVIIRFTREGYANYLECLKSSTGATFMAKSVEFKTTFPLIEILE